jgi:choline-glycine betaine transporter
MILVLFYATRPLLWSSVATWICLPIALIMCLSRVGKIEIPIQAGEKKLSNFRWGFAIFGLQIAFFAWIALAAHAMAPQGSTISPGLLSLLGNTFVYGWHPWGWVALIVILFARASPHARPSLGHQTGIKKILLQESMNFAAHGGLIISIAITAVLFFLLLYAPFQSVFALPILQPVTAFSLWLMLGLVFMSSTGLWQGIIQRLPHANVQQLWLWHWGGLFIIVLMASVIAHFWLGSAHLALTQKIDLNFEFPLNQGQSWGLFMWSMGILMGPSFALLIGKWSQGRSLRNVIVMLFIIPISVGSLLFSPQLLNRFVITFNQLNPQAGLAIAIPILVLAMIYLFKNNLDHIWMAQSPNYCSGKIARLRALFARNTGFHTYCLAFFVILGLPAMTLLSVLFAFPLFFGVLLFFLWNTFFGAKHA